MQILEQHRRAGPPGDQTDHPTDTRLQVVLECSHHYLGHRNNAHDSQGADGLPSWPSHVRSTAVLQPGLLITKPTTQPFSALLHYCDKTASGYALRSFPLMMNSHQQPIQKASTKPAKSYSYPQLTFKKSAL